MVRRCSPAAETGLGALVGVGYDILVGENVSLTRARLGFAAGAARRKYHGARAMATRELRADYACRVSRRPHNQ